MYANRKRLDAANEVGFKPCLFANDLNPTEAVHDLFPNNAKLHLCESIAHAPMDAKAEGHVVPGVGPINDQSVRILMNRVVPVPRDIPHDDFIASFHGLAAEF